jgi:hypothetical protein
MNDEMERLASEMFVEIKVLKSVPERDRGSIERGLMRFMQEAMQTSKGYIARPVQTTRPGRYGLLKGNRMRPGALAARVVMLIMLVAVLVTGGGAATVYASQDSLPGDITYPVKTWVEDMRLSLAAGPQAELDLNLAFAERRMVELARLLENEGALPSQPLLRLQNHLQRALEVTGEVTQEQALPAMERVRLTLLTNQQLMLQLQTNADPASAPVMEQAREMLQQQLRAVENQLLTEQLRQQEQNRVRQQDQTGPGEQPGNGPNGPSPAGPNPVFSNQGPDTLPGPNPGQDPGGQQEQVREQNRLQITLTPMLTPAGFQFQAGQPTQLPMGEQTQNQPQEQGQQQNQGQNRPY